MISYWVLNHITADFKDKHTKQVPDMMNKYQFDAVDSTHLFFEKFTASRVKESSIKIGLEKVDEIPLRINIIASIQGLILLEDKLTSTDVFAELNAAGTITYNRLDAYLGRVKLGRLSYAKSNEELKQLD